jgi:hypothetical protein
MLAKLVEITYIDINLWWTWLVLICRIVSSFGLLDANVQLQLRLRMVSASPFEVVRQGQRLGPKRVFPPFQRKGTMLISFARPWQEQLPNAHVRCERGGPCQLPSLSARNKPVIRRRVWLNSCDTWLTDDSVLSLLRGPGHRPSSCDRGIVSRDHSFAC